MQIPRRQGNKGHRVYTKELALNVIKDYVVHKETEVKGLLKLLKIFSLNKEILLIRNGLGIKKLGACDYLKKYYKIVFVGG